MYTRGRTQDLQIHSKSYLRPLILGRSVQGSSQVKTENISFVIVPNDNTNIHSGIYVIPKTYVERLVAHIGP